MSIELDHLRHSVMNYIRRNPSVNYYGIINLSPAKTMNQIDLVHVWIINDMNAISQSPLRFFNWTLNIKSQSLSFSNFEVWTNASLNHENTSHAHIFPVASTKKKSQPIELHCKMLMDLFFIYRLNGVHFVGIKMHQWIQFIL